MTTPSVREAARALLERLDKFGTVSIHWSNDRDAIDALRTALDAYDGEYERAIEDAAKKCDERANRCQYEIDALPREAHEGARLALVHGRNTSNILSAIIRAITPKPVAPKPASERCPGCGSEIRGVLGVRCARPGYLMNSWHDAKPREGGE